MERGNDASRNPEDGPFAPDRQPLLLVALGALPARAPPPSSPRSAPARTTGPGRCWETWSCARTRPSSPSATPACARGRHRASPTSSPWGWTTPSPDHWLVSGALHAGLPKNTFTPLARERPRLGLPALAARTSYSSQGARSSRRAMTRRASPTWSTGWTPSWASPATPCAAQHPHATGAATAHARLPAGGDARGAAALAGRAAAAGHALGAGPARRPLPL